MLAKAGASMVWSPLSNLLLYGKTADTSLAHDAGVLTALGPDWSPSGSKNLLGELKVARLVDSLNGGGLSDVDLIALATRNPAKILRWDEHLGSIEAGKRADLLVVSGAGGDAHAHLFTRSEHDVELVVVNGVPRYGASTVMRKLLGEAAAQAEAGSAGGRARLLFLTQATGDPVIGKVSLKEATDLLTDGLHRLPELAKEMDKQKVGPEDTFLVLDHEEEDGVDLRPHLPGPDGELTGMMDGFAAATPLSDLLVPLTLDPLTVFDDDALRGHACCGEEPSQGGSRPCTRPLLTMARARRASAAAAADPTLANLRKIDHIVVLMLENRSFDHMLGYLHAGSGADRRRRAEGEHVERLPGQERTRSGTSSGPRSRRTRIPATAARASPSRSATTWAASSPTSRSSARRRSSSTWSWATTTGATCPTYDHLAREFAVCDRWYCSVPGATWPNRLYALCGQAAGSKDPKKVPVYDVPSFVRHLESNKVSWRWYTHDVGTLRFTDSKFRVGYLDKFAYFDRRSILAPRNFMDDAEGREAAGRLVDRPELRRRLVRRAGGIERRPSAVGHQGRPGARAEDVHGARQQPELEEDDARGHLRRARRVLRPRAAARRARRQARVPDVRRARARVRRLAVHAARERLEHRLRPHVDHQDDPAPLLPEERPDPEHGRAGRRTRTTSATC